MGNVNMEARQVHYRGGEKPMTVEEALKEAGSSYVLPVASAETLGGVKVGDNLTIEEDGTLNTNDPYELPIADAETLGGVKVGDNLTIEEDGTLNAQTPATYSETTLFSGDGTSQSTYALSQGIENFDLIGVRFLRTNDLEIFNIYPSSYLISLITTGNSTGVATNDKWCFFGLTDSSTIVRRDESDLHVVGVVGINA